MRNRGVSALVVSKILANANPSLRQHLCPCNIGYADSSVSVMDEIAKPLQIQLHPDAPAEKLA